MNRLIRWMVTAAICSAWPVLLLARQDAQSGIPVSMVVTLKIGARVLFHKSIGIISRFTKVKIKDL